MTKCYLVTAGALILIKTDRCDCFVNVFSLQYSFGICLIRSPELNVISHAVPVKTAGGSLLLSFVT